MPDCPFVPLFRAVDTMEKERDGDKVDWSSVDIISDRNNLRKLLAWVQGGEEFFRIDVQLAGSWTMLLQRWEERPLEISDGYGFGDSFELAATTPAPGCEDATLAGHHRIISYVRSLYYDQTSYLKLTSHSRTSPASSSSSAVKSTPTIPRCASQSL